MTAFILKPHMQRWYRAALSGGPGSSAAQALKGETDGLALSFTDDFFHSSTGHYGSARVKDAGTPGNAYNSHPFGLLTYSGASPKLCRGPDGNLRYGAHNIFTASENFAAWTNNSTTTVITGAIPPPPGYSSADKIVEDTRDGFHFRFRVLTFPAGTLLLTSYVLKAAERTKADIWINNNAAVRFDLLNGQILTMFNQGNIIDAYSAPLGDGWYKCTLIARVNSGTAQSNGVRLVDESFSYQGDGVSGIYATGAELKYYPADDTYLKTTDSAVYELPYEWDTDGNLLGVVDPEAQATNLVLWSNDFTNAAWIKSNLTAAKTATGPDGVANSASTLTATDGNATALQSITSASAERITSCYIKRRTGSGDIHLTQDNGSTWTTVTVTSEWTRVEIAATTLENPTVGIRIVTSGDEVDVSLFQHEVGSAVTSPIETASSTVTRAADVFGPPLAAFPWNEGVGPYTVNGKTETPADDGTILILDAPDGHTHIQTVKWIPSP